MIREQPTTSDEYGVTFTPRLATSSDYRLQFLIDPADLQFLDAIPRDEVLEIIELENQTRWQVRKAPCSLTEPGVISCYCDAVAIPVEYPGGLSSISIEEETPLAEQLRAFQSILSSPSLHPSHRLTFEQSAKHIENTLRRQQITIELQNQLDLINNQLKDRKLAPSMREFLTLEAARRANDLMKLLHEELISTLLHEEMDGVNDGE